MTDPTLVSGYWLPSADADPRAVALYRRHYSSAMANANAAVGRRASLSFVGPGERMVLLTRDCDALFAWRRERRQDGQEGINCSVFRNEGPVLSSVLIREACDLAWGRWPGSRLFTFVNPRAIRSNNPGACFIRAGWTRLPTLTKKRRLVILERLPIADERAA